MEYQTLKAYTFLAWLFAKTSENGISDYFRYSVPAEADHVGDFLMDPSRTMEPEDAGISPYSLSGPDIRDPFIDGLLDDP